MDGSNAGALTDCALTDVPLDTADVPDLAVAIELMDSIDAFRLKE